MKKTLRLICLLVALLTAMTMTTAMAACGHNNVTAPGEAGEKYTFEQYTNTHHWRTVEFKFICNDCGYSYWMPWNTDYFPHEFSGNKCTLCGYTKSTEAAESKVNAMLNGTGNSRSILVSSSDSWTARTSDSWLTLNKTSGVNGETIQVTMAENPSTTSNRTGFVYITCGTATTTVTIVQTRGTAATPAPTYSSTSLRVGDIVTFGHYEQDGNTSNGKEPIKWVILNKSGGYALLYAVNILDVQPYNRYGHCETWLDCSLRAWLNADFRRNAFTASEQECLRTGKPFSKAQFSANDQIFLPAYDSSVTPLLEGIGLGGLFIDSNFDDTPYENVGLSAFRRARPTVYALNKNRSGCEFYREMGGRAAANEDKGMFYRKNSTSPYGVRPACWVRVSALTPAEADSADAEPLYLVKIRDSMNVYVRAEPSMNAAVLGTAQKGTVYPCVDVVGEWYLITIEDGTTGYVPASMSQLVN